MSNDALTDDERIVIEFFETWASSDPDRIVAYFTEDGGYEDKGMPPRWGRENIRTHLCGLFALMSVRIETIHLASRGNLVFSERIDYLRNTETGREFPLPVMGAVEMRAGKIAAWRDYSDTRSAEQGLGISGTGDLVASWQEGATSTSSRPA